MVVPSQLGRHRGVTHGSDDLSLSAPAAAFALALFARRVDRGAGKVAPIVSAALLTFSVWAIVAGSTNLYIGLATLVAMVVVTLLVILRLARPRAVVARMIG
jgi:hypothetical protein